MNPPTVFTEFKADSTNPTTEPSMPHTTNFPQTTRTPIQNWITLRNTLATTPEATQLLKTYGKYAWETLEHDLTRHPYLQTRPTFTHAYTNTLWHRILHAARQNGSLTNYTYKALEHITGIPAGRLRDWTLGEKEPHLERTLTIHETARQRWENQLSQEVRDHTLDPSFVYYTFKSLLDHPEHHTPEHLAHAIKQLIPTTSHTPIIIAELKPYHKIGPQGLRTIAHAITRHRVDLELLLNKHLHLSEINQQLRLAIDHDTLYLWRKTTNPDHWLNTYKDELLYLTPNTKQHLITTAKRHLNVNTQQLGQLLDQLTEHTRKRTYKPRTSPYELWSSKYSQYLYGDTLHLLTDTTNTPFHTIKPHITQIGRISNLEHGGGIQNPKFPEDELLTDLRGRLIAIALSDCHINKNTHVLTYHENDENRIEYVRNLFRTLGETDYKLEELARKRKRLTITAVVGRLLEKWGVPKGDKHLQAHFRLPKSIRNGESLIKSAYLQEVILEDGFFVNRAGAQKFGIKRTAVLHAGKKKKPYNFSSKITSKHKDFIRRFGVIQYQIFRGDKPRKQKVVSKGLLEKITSEANTRKDQQLAKELITIIENNPSQLLSDEKDLIQSLGIRTQMIFKDIRLYETGRVSTIWELYTKNKKDTKRWADIALPSSGEKRLAANIWLTNGANSFPSRESHD